MQPCRECDKRHAVPGAADSWSVWPVRQFGLPPGDDHWCMGCANELKGGGIIVWALLILALLVLIRFLV